MAETLSAQEQDQLQAAWSGTATPYSQIKESLAPDPGQYNFVFEELKPTMAKTKAGVKCYAIEVKVKFTGPPEVAQGPGSTYTRTMYVGGVKDPLAAQPDTRINNATLRWLKMAAKAAQVPCAVDQTDAALCASLLGKQISCRIDAHEYEDNGTKKTGYDFGRNPVPVGAVPAKLDGKKGSAGSEAVATAAAGGAPAQTAFAE
jgi:hypothetical protein